MSIFWRRRARDPGAERVETLESPAPAPRVTLLRLLPAAGATRSGAGGNRTGAAGRLKGAAGAPPRSLGRAGRAAADRLVPEGQTPSHPARALASGDRLGAQGPRR